MSNVVRLDAAPGQGSDESSRAGRGALLAWFVDRIELSRGTAGDNVRPMEGLRGFAVFLVSSFTTPR